MTRALALIAAALAALAAAARAEEPVVSVSPDPDGVAAGRVEATVDIAAPPGVVWAVMVDCDGAPAFVPGLRHCAVLETGPDGAWDVREHRVRWSRFAPAARNVFRADYAPQTEIRFRRIDGDLKIADGVWRLAADGAGGTRLTYDARLALGRPVPRAWVRAALKRDARAILEAVRDEAVARTAAAGTP